MIQLKNRINVKKLGFLLISLSLAACQHEKKVTTATAATQQATELSFKYDSVKVYSKKVVDIGKGAKDTTKATFFYPVFTDAVLNQFVMKMTRAGSEDTVKATSYQEMAKSFVKGYDDFLAEDGSYAQSWFLDEKTEVIEHKKNYLSMLHTSIDYSGGAHPNSAAIYWNYDPEQHREILLEDLINPGARPQLVAVAEKIFRKNEKLTPVASLADNYFFKDNKFDLNSNFTITKEGLKFLYNPYEIKAYAYGTTELIIPFSDLAPIARPNSLLSTAK